MEIKEIYRILKEKIGDDFIDESPKELNFIDRYYIDKERRKFILVCKVFKDEKELLDNWEYYQDEDIALILQNNIFKNDDIRWDMYYLLIYRGNKIIDQLKSYEIERNRFCCKKIVISAKSKDIFEQDLTLKLPITNIYLNFNGKVDVANEDYFFDSITKKANIDIKQILEILNYNE